MTTTTDDAVTGAVPDDELSERHLSAHHLPAPRHFPRPGPVSASLTHGWRALLKIKHIPEQLLDATLYPVIFTLMFTYLFGGALAGSTGDYLQFFLPGVMVMNVVMITMYTGGALNTDVAKGIFDRFRTLPVWRPSVLVGALLADALRYAVAAGIVLALGVALGYRPQAGVLGVLGAIALLLIFSFSLSWIWTMLGLILRTEKSVMGVSMMVLFPLAFISNIIVDPATMPSGLQVAVDLNPITHLVTAVRGLMDASGTLGQVGLVLGISAALVAVFGPVTMRLYRAKS